MRIRSITCFCSPGQPDFRQIFEQLKKLVNFCKEEFHQAGWEVQTSRMATPSFGLFTHPQERISEIQELEKEVNLSGFNYLSIGPARMSYPEEYELIPEILANTKNVFSSGFIAHPFKGISIQAVKACASIIKKTATLTPDGFTNLRFCAMSRVQPFTPYFPAAYSYGSRPAFSLAVESADAAVAAFTGAKTLAEGREILVNALSAAAEKLSKTAEMASHRFDIPFKGFDFSLAPFPEEWCSIGSAMETLGVEQLGFIGSLTCAAVLAESLDRGKWKRAGFNGLMLPVLEDNRLAERSESPDFTIKDLLLYSAVCGTGLDTVPLPGDIPAEKIEPLLVDIAALSLRLRKPLTARLMPVPGLKANDQTQFDFDFFKNGRVLDFPAAGLAGLLGKSDWVEIRKREANIQGK